MVFEVAVVPVARRRRRWPLPAVLATLAVVAGAAFATSGGRAAPGPVTDDDAARRGIQAQGPAGPESVRLEARVAPSAEPRALPERIDCRDLGRTACLRVARAALGAVPADAPPVLEVRVWTSLLCSDDLECPPGYLADSVPLGSVLVRFTDGGPMAAVNVVDWRPAEGIRLGPRAWLARWMPDGGG